MRKILILCLLSFCLANAAKRSLAVMPCIGDFDVKGLERLRDKLEEVTREVLPSADFRLIPYKDVLQEVGDEELFNACEEQGICFGRLTAQMNADYGAWCKVNKYDGKLILKFEIYSVGDKDLIYTKGYDNYNPKNLDDLVKILNKEVPIAIREKIPGVVKADDPSKAKPYDKPETGIAVTSKTSFWVALGLDALGVAALGIGLQQHFKAAGYYDDYKESVGDEKKELKKKVEDTATMSNIFYITGGVLLATGIGVHIWF